MNTPMYITPPSTIKYEVYLKILPIYLTELQKLSDSLTLHSIRENASELLAITHKMKGSALNYGAFKVEENARILEQSVMAKTPLIIEVNLKKLLEVIDFTLEEAESMLKS